MASLFRPNRNFARELAGEGEYSRGLAQAAKPAADAANHMAEETRIMPSQGKAIEVTQDADGVRIVNTDHGWHLEEYGSANNPAYAPLRRGVRAAGMRLEES